jgi:hypothetical protein
VRLGTAGRGGAGNRRRRRLIAPSTTRERPCSRMPFARSALRRPMDRRPGFSGCGPAPR